MVYRFFDKKSMGGGVNKEEENLKLANELHKPIIRKIERRKVYSLYKEC